MGYYRGDYYRGDYYAGDPFSLGGLLGGIANVIGGAGIPIVSTVANVAGRILGGSSGSTPPPSQITPILPPTMGGGFTGIQAQTPFGGFSVGSGVVPPSFPGGPVAPGVVGSIPTTMTAAQAAACGLKGTHLNKSTYVRRKGGLQLVPKGSVCVKNRHRNPTNGRALRRALSRAYAFKNIAMKTLHLVSPKKRHVFAGFKRRKRA